MKNETFILTSKRTSPVNRKGTDRLKPAILLMVLARSTDGNLWFSFRSFEEARGAAWCVRHFARFRAVMGRA